MMKPERKVLAHEWQNTTVLGSNSALLLTGGVGVGWWAKVCVQPHQCPHL